MKINLNNEVTVVLKCRGVGALNKHYERLAMKPPKEYKVGQEYTGPLWDIMHVFGEYCYMGPESPIGMIIDITNQMRR